jgi:hypothetical protein
MLRKNEKLMPLGLKIAVKKQMNKTYNQVFNFPSFQTVLYTLVY